MGVQDVCKELGIVCTVEYVYITVAATVGKVQNWHRTLLSYILGKLLINDGENVNCRNGQISDYQCII